MQCFQFLYKGFFRFLIAVYNKNFIPIGDGDRFFIGCFCFKTLVSKYGLKHKVIALFLQL